MGQPEERQYRPGAVLSDEQRHEYQGEDAVDAPTAEEGVEDAGGAPLGHGTQIIEPGVIPTTGGEPGSEGPGEDLTEDAVGGDV